MPLRAVLRNRKALHRSGDSGRRRLDSWRLRVGHERRKGRIERRWYWIWERGRRREVRHRRRGLGHLGGLWRQPRGCDAQPSPSRLEALVTDEYETHLCPSRWCSRHRTEDGGGKLSSHSRQALRIHRDGADSSLERLCHHGSLKTGRADGGMSRRSKGRGRQSRKASKRSPRRADSSPTWTPVLICTPLISRPSWVPTSLMQRGSWPWPPAA